MVWIFQNGYLLVLVLVNTILWKLLMCLWDLVALNRLTQLDLSESHFPDIRNSCRDILSRAKWLLMGMVRTLKCLVAICIEFCSLLS